jgi:hypothetical protein
VQTVEALLRTGRSWVPVPMRSLNLLNLPNPSSRTMALGLTHPLREMSTEVSSGGNARPARKADSLTATCEPIIWTLWDAQHLTAL